MATVDKNANDIAAHLPEVRRAVKTQADQIATQARALLAPHRRTGDHRIEVTAGRVDALVSLVGDAALSVEFGRGASSRSGAMQGLYIISRAAGLGHH
ncbi:MAG: DUF5403 family protein [Streptosporangiales bacterium]|nr:DUF5403 family protein [Streptosporangiales bacterium]